MPKIIPTLKGSLQILTISMFLQCVGWFIALKAMTFVGVLVAEDSFFDPASMIGVLAGILSFDAFFSESSMAYQKAVGKTNL